MIKYLYFKQLDLAAVICLHSVECQTVLFDPHIGPYQVLPFKARVDLGVMAMKGHSKHLHCWSLTIILFSVICPGQSMVEGLIPWQTRAVGVFCKRQQTGGSVCPRRKVLLILHICLVVQCIFEVSSKNSLI